jgi:dolichyl-diphosphooligosaccharide--protein glycosyltransferase|tara:strand:+ start:863 stop:3118 length:2256 start_codon:yes stop_codon:yes gene_type:complete
MLSNAKLFSVGDFDFRFQHLLIIGILALSVTTSALIRAQPADFGFVLHEFDPYFNFRATQYIVDNGFEAYLEWHDDMSWHPHGRDVSATSQVSLHYITAILYNIFGGNSPLLEFTILFPLIIGSLTSVVVFALVRVIGGTTAGLLASLMFAISLPILLRGLIGWYKSEPLGLFFSFIAVYLFLSAIKTNKGKISFAKLIFGGLFLSLGLSSWGGVQFFLMPLGAFFVALPFFKSDNKFLLWAIPVFSGSILLTTLLFERPGVDFILGYGGALIVLPTIIMIAILIVQKFSKADTKIRNSIISLGVLLSSGLGIISLSNINLPTFRYQNAINPFLSAEDALTTSVSEHQQTTLDFSFAVLSTFIIFGVIGIWLLFSYRTKKANFLIPNHMKAFALIFGIIGLYASSAFVRLEIYGSVALIILGSIGITILLQRIFDNPNIVMKLIFCSVIIGLFITPMIFPERNWVTHNHMIPSVFNGATNHPFGNNDWIDTGLWLQNNTPADSIIFSWWDWGYFIQTLGERTTLIDNATLIDWQIEKVARTLLSSPDDAWIILNTDHTTNVIENFVTVPPLYKDTKTISDHFLLQGFEAPLNAKGEKYHPPVTGLYSDYILIFLAAERYWVMNSVTGEELTLYDLSGGGDESKKYWYARIAGVDPAEYVVTDGITPTQEFVDNTLFGKLIPFTIVTYVDIDTMNYYENYRHGLTPLYIKDITLTDPDGPFTLEYASPSFHEQGDGSMLAVLIYKINHNYSQ